MLEEFLFLYFIIYKAPLSLPASLSVLATKLLLSQGKVCFVHLCHFCAYSNAWPILDIS